MVEPLASVSRVAMIGLQSTSVSLIDMSVLARWKVRPRLMGIPGVANVSIYGLRDRQLQVQVDPSKLRGKDVTLTQVIETAGNALWVSPLTFVEASTPGTGGFIEGKPTNASPSSTCCRSPRPTASARSPSRAPRHPCGSATSRRSSRTTSPSSATRWTRRPRCSW